MVRCCMKILFLNCANRKDCEYLKNYVISNNVDIVILAESKNVRKELSKEFKYAFLSSYKFGYQKYHLKLKR